MRNTRSLNSHIILERPYFHLSSTFLKLPTSGFLGVTADANGCKVMLKLKSSIHAWIGED